MYLPVITILFALASSSPASVGGPEVIEATYGLSDGFDLRASIELRRDGSFAFSWEGCTGPIAHATGTYFADASSVKFDPKDTQFEKDVRTFASTMLRVRWGRREYLIPEERLLAFVNAINAGSEPRAGGMGVFYLKKGDQQIAASGSPDLSEAWRSYILSTPLKGKVVRVLQRETTTTRPLVVLDTGSEKGLRPGMELFSFNERRPSFKAYLLIQNLNSETAEAKVTFQVRHIRVGDEWSTRPPR